MQRPFRSILTLKPRRAALLFSVLALFLLALPGGVLAAQIVDSETYRLPQGEVVSDDLVVTAQEVIIDGTIEGDLVAFGAYVEVNGMVTGDLIAAAAEVRINGVVQDDARVAGAGVHVTGSVGDDLFAAAGGGWAMWPGLAALPADDSGRTVIPGLTTSPTAALGGDAYLAAGQGTVDGVFRGDLFAAMESLTFKARVDGNAQLRAGRLNSSETAQVAGNLTYSVGRGEPSLPQVGGTSTQIQPKEKPELQPERRVLPLFGFAWWLLRTALLLAGTLLLAAILWRFAPDLFAPPTQAIERKPAEAILYGILVAAAALPVSAALAFLVGIFWGWFPAATAVFSFTFGFFTLAWVFSPILAGYWLGRRLLALFKRPQHDLYALLAGSGAIVLAARFVGAVPCIGGLFHWLIYLAAFALAAGGILLAWRAPVAEPSPAA